MAITKPFSDLYNEISVIGAATKITMKRKDGIILHTFIDTDDLHRLQGIGGAVVSQYHHDIKGYYAVFLSRGGVKNRMRACLHRFIMNPPAWLEVDHINHDSLDNRKSNLRIVCRHENCTNRKKALTPHPNVRKDLRKGGLWCVQFERQGKLFFKEHFCNLTDAIRVSDEVREKLINIAH